MRPNAGNLLIALGISALMAYGFWAIGGDLRTYVGVGGFTYLAGTLIPAIGINYELQRAGVNLRIVCGIFFVLGLAINGGFALLGSSTTAYILVSAISFLVYLFLGNVIYGARQ